MNDTTYNYWYGNDCRQIKWSKESEKLAKIALTALKKLIEQN